MYFLYNILVSAVPAPLRAISLFNKKMNLFVEGRKNTFEYLKTTIHPTDKTIWIHCASLGEFEQGRPIIERLKKQYTNYKIVLTFYSPSGYEVQKNYEHADVICYLPLDSKVNAERFMDLVHPEFIVFVKYEFWPNFLKVIKERKIQTILISGIFRPKQSFFKSYGAWMRKVLYGISHFFVQDKFSKELLAKIGIADVTVCGDTRFDRVYEITKQNNNLDFINQFKRDKITVVAGSTWKSGEDLLVDFINKKAESNVKFIIAPHNIVAKDIKALKARIKNKKVVLYSEKDKENVSEADVFIIDTIGILTKIYFAADIAYVGGGFVKGGLHNTLEPATFGVPVIIGPHYRRFIEAKNLVKKGGIIPVRTQYKFDETLDELINNSFLRAKQGTVNEDFIKENLGATETIMNYIVSETNLK